MAETTCPVFHPTEEQFQNFHSYIRLIEYTHPDAGICKIIPPKSWYVREYDIDNMDLRIKSPIQQMITGRGGVFQVDLLESRAMTVQQMRAYGEKNKYENDCYFARERTFWRTIVSGTSGLGDPIYGADVPGTLFANSPNLSHPSWNLNKLENLLRVIKDELPGVNSPMIYVGSWRALFAYHVEDMDLYSINYLHCGAAKSWYSIPPKNRKKFEGVAESYFADDFRSCKEFLRHKTKLFSPSFLRDNCVSFDSVLQFPGEFVVTFPGSYHAGFNHGFNIAEATNFATNRWIEIGRIAKPCVCRPHNVHIDVDQLETYLLREKVKRKNLLRNIYTSGEAKAPRLADSDANSPTLDIKETYSEEQNQLTVTQSSESVAPDPAFGEVDSHLTLLTDTGNLDENEAGYFDESKYRVRCFCKLTRNDNLCYGDVSPVTFMAAKDYFEKQLKTKFHNHSSSDKKAYRQSLNNVKNRELLLCSTCELWFHPECVMEEYNHHQMYDFSFLQIPMCHICHIIEYSHCFDETPNCNYEKRKRKISKVMHADKKLTVVQPSTVNKNKTSADTFMVENSKAEVKKNSIVQTVLPGHVVPTIGSIVDIQGELARFHVKDSKRSEDVWIEIATCEVVDLRNCSPKENIGINKPKNSTRSQSLSTVQDDARSDIENIVVDKRSSTATGSITFPLDKDSLPSPVLATSKIFDCNPLALPPKKSLPIAGSRVRKKDGMSVRDIAISSVQKGMSIMTSKDKILSIRRPSTASSTTSE